MDRAREQENRMCGTLRYSDVHGCAPRLRAIDHEPKLECLLRHDAVPVCAYGFRTDEAYGALHRWLVVPDLVEEAAVRSQNVAHRSVALDHPIAEPEPATTDCCNGRKVMGDVHERGPLAQY